MSRLPEATRIVIQSYSAGVRAWIKKRGGLTGKLIYLRGRSSGPCIRGASRSANASQCKPALCRKRRFCAMFPARRKLAQMLTRLRSDVFP
jgi:hypothetical protein